MVLLVSLRSRRMPACSAAGVDVQVLGAAELPSRYPSFRFAWVDCGALSLADGEIDPMQR